MKIFHKILLIFVLIITFSSAAAGDLRDAKIAVLYSKYTESMMPDNPLWVIDQLTLWELYFIENRIPYEVIEDADLESGLSNDFDLLVLPAAKSMSSAQLDEIKNFMIGGKSVFALWNIGSYDEQGSFRGWNEFENIFGVNFIREINKSEVSRIQAVNGNISLTAGIPPGFRFQLIMNNKPIEVKPSSPTTRSFGGWYNSDSVYIGNPETATSMVYGNYSLGKFIWFGFDLTAVDGSRLYKENFKKILNNSLHWLINEPVVWVNTWPFGKNSAVVFSCDVEDQFININNALDIYEKENIIGQFYILTDVMERDAFDRILKFGDIGIHGDNHDVFKWQDYSTQFARLSSVKEILQLESGRDIYSFRPPETIYDQTTLKILEELNIKIISADFVEDRAVPQYLTNEIMLMPKTGLDDYDIISLLKIDNTDKQAVLYLNDYRRVNEEGGLYTLNYHSQFQSLPKNVAALGTVIQEVKKHNSWITTHHAVKDWWIKKEKINVDLNKISDSEFSLTIKNSGSSLIENAVISFSKNDFLSDPVITAESAGTVLKHEYDFVNNQVKIFLDKLEAGQEKIIKLLLGNI
jgi:peptidoglycan/xylan/chitin deacetylase (PgdA/CDA1 family)